MGAFFSVRSGASDVAAAKILNSLRDYLISLAAASYDKYRHWLLMENAAADVGAAWLTNWTQADD